jgi:uncharacterized protein with HEPN domain
MLMLQRDPRLQADDVLQAIANIEADTAGLDFERFVADRRVRQLVERNFEIVSEQAVGSPPRNGSIRKPRSSKPRVAAKSYAPA